MAGIRGRSGGARKGSGRKSRVDEVGAQSIVARVLTPDKLVAILIKVTEQALAGDRESQKRALEYGLGKAVETHNVQSDVIYRIVDDSSD